MIICQPKEFYYSFDPIIVSLKSAIFAFFFLVYVCAGPATFILPLEWWLFIKVTRLRVCDWIMASLRHPQPNPRSCGWVTLQGKRDFADVIQIKIWDEEIILDYPVGASMVTRTLIRGGQKVIDREKVMWEQKQRERPEDETWFPVALKTEEGPWAKVGGSL